MEEVLRTCLPRLDERLRRGGGLGWLFGGPLHPFAACGSTCVAAAVDLERHELVVANIGDSRAMLLRDGKAGNGLERLENGSRMALKSL